MITNEGELTDLHKDVVLYLFGKKEANYIELEKKLGRDRRHIINKCGELNDRGVLHHREDPQGKKYYRLNKNKVKISYSTDRYKGILMYFGLFFLLSVFIGMVFNQPYFITGSVFLGFFMFSRYFFEIITEKEGKIVRIL